MHDHNSYCMALKCVLPHKLTTTLRSTGHSTRQLLLCIRSERPLWRVLATFLDWIYTMVVRDFVGAYFKVCPRVPCVYVSKIHCSHNYSVSDILNPRHTHLIGEWAFALHMMMDSLELIDLIACGAEHLAFFLLEKILNVESCFHLCSSTNAGSTAYNFKDFMWGIFEKLEKGFTGNLDGCRFTIQSYNFFLLSPTF